MLSVSDLVVTYGETVAVNGVSFTVDDGEFVTLLGPSGCGKTTTLRCIAGLESAAAGSVVIDGRVVSAPGVHIRPENREINMVFQSYAVWPHMSVFNNVAYGLRVRRLNKAEIRERVDEALSLVGLREYRDRYGTELSGGQQQRVALARAIVTEPKLLLFDEPLSNLDAGLRERMRVDLADLQKRIGRSAVYVTHDQEEAMVMSDTIVLMRAGEIEQTGGPRDIYRRPRTRFAASFIGAANVLEAVVTAAGAEDFAVSVGDHLDVRATPPADGSTVLVGDSVELVVRPEDVVVVDDGEAAGANVWSARVVRVAYLGHRLEYVLDVSGVRVRAEGTDRPDIQVGDVVLVALDPALVTCLV